MRSDLVAVIVFCSVAAGCGIARYESESANSARVVVESFDYPLFADAACSNEGFSFLAVSTANGTVQKIRRSRFYLKPGQYWLHYSYERYYKEQDQCRFHQLTPIITHTKFGIPALNISVEAAQSYKLSFLNGEGRFDAL